MAPMIDIDFDNTPDGLLPISTGIRTLRIMDVTQKESETSGSVIVTAELSVEEEGSEENERRVWDRFNFEYPPARIKFKQLCKSAGLSAGGHGIDSSSLIGQIVKAAVKPRTYVDPDTKETIQTTQIQRYLFSKEGD